jgi:hypothetical protein
MPRPIAYAAVLALTMLVLPLSPAMSAANLPRLLATIGPEHEISLMRGGSRVSTISRGTYLIVVRDRSKIDNFHLEGPENPAAPQVDRRTKLPFVGMVTWRVTFRGGGRYFFRSDRRSSTIGGSFRVR